MTSEAVSISIILPVKNGESVIGQAIESILSQTIRDWELLITDDGSSDQTENVIRQFSDPRIRLFHHPDSKGVATTLNEMIRAARGEFVARMDADDLCHPERLEKQRRFLRRRPDVDLCGSAAETFGEKKTIYRFPSRHEEIRALLLFQPSLLHPSVMWRAEAFRKNNLFYQEVPPTAEDYELWVRASEKVRLANLPEPLLLYRIDPSIKDSPYVLQQKEGDRIIKEQLLERLGLRTDPNSMAIHHALSVNRFSGKEAPEMDEFEQWMLKIEQANRTVGLFGQAELRHLLKERYYWLLSERPDLGLARIRRFWRRFPDLDPFAFSVMLRLFLKNLFGRRGLRKVG